jgi:hypothetical protein
MTLVSDSDRTDDTRGGPPGPLAHLTPEQLDELAAQASADWDPDEPPVTSPADAPLQAHLDSCPACRAALGDQVAVSALLHRVPDPGPMPSEYATRLDAAIISAQADRQAAATASGPSDATVLPLALSGRSRSRWGAIAESRLTKVLVAAAAVVVIGAGGYAAFHRTTSPNTTASGGSSDSSVLAPSAGAVPTRGTVQSLAQVPVQSSGTAYTKGNLAAQVTSRLSSAGGAVAPKANQAAAVAGGSTLGTVAGIKACLAAIAAPSAVPELIDLATFEGKPAAVLVLPDTNGTKEVWVVSRTCSGTNDGTLFFEPLP